MTNLEKKIIEAVREWTKFPNLGNLQLLAELGKELVNGAQDTQKEKPENNVRAKHS